MQPLRRLRFYLVLSQFGKYQEQEKRKNSPAVFMHICLYMHLGTCVYVCMWTPLQYSWASLVDQTVKNPSVLQMGLKALHFSVLAWRIPQTEEPDGLRFLGLQSRTCLSNQAQHMYVYKHLYTHTHVYRSIFMHAGDPGSIPGSGRSPGEGNGNPLQCSCLGNPTDRRAWRATVHRVTKEPNTTEQRNSNVR